MRPRVWNKRTETPPPGAVYVGRPSRWGNPYRASVVGRGQAIALFEEYVRKHPQFQEQIKLHLKGKDLVCWCKPSACHADILLRIANEDK